MLGRFKVNEITKGEGAEAIVVRKVIFIPAKPAENKEGSADSKGGPSEDKDKGEPADEVRAPAAPSARPRPSPRSHPAQHRPKSAKGKAKA
jgi:hypothetical protein